MIAIKQYNTLLKEIKKALASDEIIARLMLHSQSNALEQQTTIVLPDNVLPYISIAPMVSLPEMSVTSGSNVATFITVHLNQVQFRETASYAIVTISIVCSENIYLLDRDDSRILLLANRTMELLNNTKFSPAQELRVDNLQEIYYNNNVVGYDLVIGVSGEQKTNVPF